MPRITTAELAAIRERLRRNSKVEFGGEFPKSSSRVKQSLKHNKLRDVPEREIQNDIEQYLRLNGIYFVRSRMDKRTSTACGVPDFIVCRNLQPHNPEFGADFVALEVKRVGQIPTPEQLEHAQSIQQSGGRWYCVRSLAEAIEALKL